MGVTVEAAKKVRQSGGENTQVSLNKLFDEYEVRERDEGMIISVMQKQSVSIQGKEPHLTVEENGARRVLDAYKKEVLSKQPPDIELDARQAFETYGRKKGYQTLTDFLAAVEVLRIPHRITLDGMQFRAADLENLPEKHGTSKSKKVLDKDNCKAEDDNQLVTWSHAYEIYGKSAGYTELEFLNAAKAAGIVNMESSVAQVKMKDVREKLPPKPGFVNYAKDVDRQEGGVMKKKERPPAPSGEVYVSDAIERLGYASYTSLVQAMDKRNMKRHGKRGYQTMSVKDFNALAEEKGVRKMPYGKADDAQDEKSYGSGVGGGQPIQGIEHPQVYTFSYSLVESPSGEPHVIIWEPDVRKGIYPLTQELQQQLFGYVSSQLSKKPESRRLKAKGKK